MAHVFEVQVKSQGRIVIPNYVRLAMGIRPGDWVVIQISKREEKKEKRESEA